MTETQAKEKAESLRKDAGVPDGFALESAAKRYIELSEETPNGGYLVRDVLVWIARFAKQNSFWEFAIDDTTGLVVRTQKTR
ncbi:MAG: hypothetical protein M3Y08_08945 [Fibrobacterota bacterium]|nr:hypothetical protein [Fibrobacterota bacterium]